MSVLMYVCTILADSPDYMYALFIRPRMVFAPCGNKKTHMPRDRAPFPVTRWQWFANGRARAAYPSAPPLQSLLHGRKDHLRGPAGPAGRCTGRLSKHRDNYGRIFAPLHAFSRKAFILHQLPQGKHLNHPPDIPGSYNRRTTGMEGAADRKNPRSPGTKVCRHEHPDTFPKRSAAGQFHLSCNPAMRYTHECRNKQPD